MRSGPSPMIEKPQIVVEDAEEVGGPDEILDALLRPESADDADQLGIGRTIAARGAARFARRCSGARGRHRWG